MLEPDERIADDEQRPPVTDDPEGSGDPALGGSKIGALSLHLCLLLQRYSAPPPCQFAKQTETIPMRGMAPAPPALLAGPTIVRSEEHTSELQSLMRTSYAVFCLKKKKKQY